MYIHINLHFRPLSFCGWFVAFRIEKLNDNSVYIDKDSNICTGDPDNCIIIKYNNKYVTPDLPDKEAEPPVTKKSCKTGNVDSCNLRNNASDHVVSIRVEINSNLEIQSYKNTWK